MLAMDDCGTTAAMAARWRSLSTVGGVWPVWAWPERRGEPSAGSARVSAVWEELTRVAVAPSCAAWRGVTAG